MSTMNPYQGRGPELAGVIGLILGLAAIFTSLRVYVRAFITKSWALDDSFLLIALALFSTYCACSATGIHYGTGRHLVAIPPEHVPKGLYNWWLCELFYTLSTVFVRLSISIFLLRICLEPIPRRIIYGTMTVIILFSTAYFFLALFQCTPYTYFWQQYIPGHKGQCINAAVIPITSIVHSALSFTADFMLVLAPLLVIHKLQMNLRTKIVVCALLSLGILAGIATLIRIPYIKVLSLTDDFLFATTDVAIWSTVEPGLGIMAAAGACLRPLFRNFFGLGTKNTAGPAGTNGTIGSNRLKWPGRSSRAKSGIQLKSDLESRNEDLKHHGTFTTSTSRGDTLTSSSEGESGITVEKTVFVKGGFYDDASDRDVDGKISRGRDEKYMV